jgi:hypothetical protein
MNVKKAIKRIVALGTGAALMGATVLGAMAADLNNFPAPFVEDGQFNAMIIVGESAATADVIGAVDIATTLQYEMKEAASVGGASGSSVTVAGDSFELRLDNDALELGDTLGSVIPSLEEEDLAALSGGELANEKYDESIDLGAGIAVWDEPTDGEYDNEPGEYLYWNEGDALYTYILEFNTPAESDIVDGRLKDFEDKTIRFMGQAYTVSKAEIATNGDFMLELLGGDSNDVIEEYATKTYNVNGKEYEVEATYIDTKAKFRVNGEVTDALAEDETYELADGTEIGVREVLENEAGEGGQDIVEFYLGASKVVLENGENLVVGDETYNDVTVTISATNSTKKASLESIEVAAVASNDYWLAAGDVLSELVDGSDEDYMFGNFDILFGGLTEPVSSEVKLSADSEYQYSLEFETNGGLDYSLPLWYAEDVNRMGDEDGSLLLTGNISKDDMFILGTTAASPEDVEGRIYRFTDYDTDDRKITIKDLAGDSTTITLTTDYNKSVRIDGEYHLFTLHNYSASVGGTLTVSGRATQLGLKSGSYLTVGGNATEANFTITVPGDLVDSDSAEVFGAIVRSDATPSPDEITDTGAIMADLGSFIEVKKDVDVAYSSKYGVIVTRDDTGDDTEWTFDVPHAQRLPQAFGVSGEVSTSAVEGVSGSAYSIAPVKSGIAMLDTEVGSSWRNGNAIVVGGPCRNSVAAELMGNPAECTEGFTAGSAMIKLFEQSGDNVAMLVAGYSAEDTRRAATAVNKFRSYSGFRGMEVKVSGTSMSDISVTSVQ